MNEFHKIDWKEKLKLMSNFKDERLKYFGKKLLYEESPDNLSKKDFNEIHKMIAERILSTSDEKWNTIPRTYAEIDTLRAKFDREDNKEKMNLLNDISNYIEEIENVTNIDFLEESTINKIIEIFVNVHNEPSIEVPCLTILANYLNN